MNKSLLQTTCVLAFSAISCWANTIHGFCGGPLQCIDNGQNSPTTNNPPINFGFALTGNGTGTGTLLIDILVPYDPNIDPTPSTLPFLLDGTLPGTAGLFIPTPTPFSPWTSGFLSSYLGISPSNKNPIGAFLDPSTCSTSKPCTATVDPGAKGFYVYQASFSTPVNSSPSWNFDSSDPALPIGSFITGFFTEGSGGTNSDWTATPNSAAIFVDAAPPLNHDPASTPEPASLVLFGSATLGVAFFLRRKARTRA